ncbi:type I-E CRISPR-associated protein Cse1/CasA [Streptomyces sp. CAU 1734]|uniref:type I-E CRISPR-associated protein Cse1/CasA n=1 Tax=Streptomyces sp. CAU 1734 TaxID=3140360 RepID=UPI003261C627
MDSGRLRGRPASAGARRHRERSTAVNGDLVRDGWLPAIGVDGGRSAEGILSVLTRAHLIRRLELPDPMMLPAVLRQVLLPVVLDALGAPRTPGQWAERFERGGFTPEETGRLEDYLGPRFGDRFRLFDEARPFAQVAGLEAVSGETKSSVVLVPSIASGNNVPLFSSFSEADELDLTPAQAMLWLLHVQCWDTAAIKTGAAGDPAVVKGKTTGNPTGPLGQLGVIVPAGRTLYETLLLNLPIMPDGLGPGDRPQWAWDERRAPAAGEDPSTARWSSRPVSGLLDLMTFQSRRVRLIPEETGDGPRVRRVVLCAGDRLESTPQEEVHTAWNHAAKPKAGQPAQRPRRHVSGKAAWQGLAALLALDLPADGNGPTTSALLRQAGDLSAEDYLAADYPLGVEICALEYGNQSAVVENAIADSLPLPVTALVAGNPDVREAVLGCAAQADQAGRALDRFHADLRRAAGGDPLPRDKGERPSLRFLHAVDGRMRRLLAGLRTVGEDWDLLERGREAWELTLWQEAGRETGQLLAAVPPRAVVGRVTRENNKETVHRSGRAEMWLWKTLREALPRAADAHGDGRGEAA